MQVSNKEVIIPSYIKGGQRLKLLQYHRLIEFERVFSLYIEGKTSADRVRDRANKMLEVGLPNKL